MKGEELGNRLKELRTEYGYTQSAISSFLGVDQSLISKYESGERAIGISALEKLEELYCCDLVCEPPVLKNDITVAFRADNVSVENMEAIRAVNKVVRNTLLMRDLLSE